jgi:hypothetical protein
MRAPTINALQAVAIERARAIALPVGAAYIALDYGLRAAVDAADLLLLAAFEWRARVGTSGIVYAAHHKRDRYVPMHQVITDFAHPVIDHRDRNGLNNTRDNLRPCTASENQCNRGKNRNNTAGFKGVFSSGGGRWRAKLMHCGEQFYLGTHDTPEEAARAYDLKAIALHGEFALLNFPGGA